MYLASHSIGIGTNSINEDLRKLVEKRIKITRHKLENQNLEHQMIFMDTQNIKTFYQKIILILI